MRKTQSTYTPKMWRRKKIQIFIRNYIEMLFLLKLEIYKTPVQIFKKDNGVMLREVSTILSILLNIWLSNLNIWIFSLMTTITKKKYLQVNKRVTCITSGTAQWCTKCALLFEDVPFANRLLVKTCVELLLANFTYDEILIAWCSNYWSNRFFTDLFKSKDTNLGFAS